MWLLAEDKTIVPSPSARPARGSSSKVQSSLDGGASSSEVAAPSNLPIPRIAEAITVSFPQSNSEALSSPAKSSVVSRTVSSSGDPLVSSPSNEVLSNVAVTCVLFNGVSSEFLFNGGSCDPFNGGAFGGGGGDQRWCRCQVGVEVKVQDL